MTENVPVCPSTGVIGTVSTHRVKEPQRWTCSDQQMRTNVLRKSEYTHKYCCMGRESPI